MWFLRFSLKASSPKSKLIEADHILRGGAMHILYFNKMTFHTRLTTRSAAQAINLNKMSSWF